ncbi:GIY-YIG nuclease family protein [Methylobacterium sp. J-030]|uniref:GIY-YIG nuclease family protein n=1 Tax=Methylobacterium sp. J-030 TaxID=2836627 RepID=UPI001FBBE3DA|nr:GIY-YIG nuclease family protein [Methylobacterium sp. J-030]MCJ2067444.1 GIY-YIG nuclease family protein [Methylobacterium sp. J-030]
MAAFVYRLRCSDGSDYVGSARGESLDKRLSEHQAGMYPGYTSRRRPGTLVYAEQFDRAAAIQTIPLILRCRSVAEASKEPSRGHSVVWRAPARPADAGTAG